MNESNNRRQVAVGVFIFIGLIILVTGILTIGGNHKTFVKTVSVKSVFDDVSGLQSGNNVWLSGVKIGTVKRLAFTGHSQVEVLMNIEKQAIPYVRKDSRAKISSDGLIGNKIIVIYGGTDGAGDIANGDYLRTERGISTEDRANTLQENNKNLLAITGDFKTISRRLTGAEGTIGALINDPALAGRMRATISNLDLVSANSEKVITNLVNYTAALNRQGVFANQLVSDTVIFRELRGTVVQLKQAASDASDFSEKLKSAGNGLSQTNTPVGLLLHDQGVATDMKTTVRNLQTSSEKLDEDLEAVQHNFLLRGFFRRKAKSDAKKAKAVQASPGVTLARPPSDSASFPAHLPDTSH
jgi:phospholipid/cholesterol/gamma-HCH transport system substrate-binding protein